MNGRMRRKLPVLVILLNILSESQKSDFTQCPTHYTDIDGASDLWFCHAANIDKLLSYLHHQHNNFQNGHTDKFGVSLTQCQQKQNITIIIAFIKAGFREADGCFCTGLPNNLSKLYHWHIRCIDLLRSGWPTVEVYTV